MVPESDPNISRINEEIQQIKDEVDKLSKERQQIQDELKTIADKRTSIFLTFFDQVVS